MDQVTWPDGYEINFIYNASFDLIAIEDNRNQRAEFSWSQDLVSSIEIDTDYDGTTFVPVLEIDYTYSLPGPNSSWSGIRELEQATTTQIATGEILSDHSYWYSDNGAGRGLVSTLDGTTGAAPGTNQSNIPYGNYSYLFGIATSTEHAGGVERFERTSPGGNPTITNPLGKVTEYFYETVAGQPRVSQINGQATASCLGTAKSFDYTPNAGAPEGYVYEQIERNGSKTTFARDSRGLILTQTEDADGTFPRVTTYTWHSTLRLPLTRTTSQMEETFVYDGDGQLTSYTQRDVLFGSPSVNATRTWAYTFSTLASGLKVMTSMDGPGLVANGTTDVTTFTHNADGTMASSTDPNGLTTTYANYDGFGNPTRIVQPDGVAWALTFDAEGQLTQVIENVDRNSANTSTFAYDLVGQMTSYTNGSNKTWTFAYDKARRMVQTVNPDGETIDYTYDLAGNIAKTEYSQANGQITFFQDFAFDELSRLKDILGAEGQTAAFTYDEEDNLATAVDAISLMTSHSYDALNRMTQTVDRASGTTLMEHDDAGQMTRYTDPRGIDTDMTYNGFGDVVQELSADRGTMTYSYNNRGLVSSMTDGRGIVSNYNYDDGGRLTARTFPSAPAENVSFYYDFGNGDNEGEGKIGFIDDESGHTYFRYERGGHLVQENPTIEYTYYRVSYSVDNYGRVYEMKTPGKLEVKYAYDNQDRVRYIRVERKVRDPITNQFPPAVTVLNQVKYEPFGPLKSMNYAGGGAHTRSYDNSYRLTGLTDLVYGATPRDVAHSWTSRDNLSIASDAVNGLNTETYQYSAREFLSQATGPYDQIGFTYDAVGNRTSRAVTDISTVTDTYTYPLTSNRLQSVALGADGTRSLTYDAAGNVTYDNRNGPGYGYAYNAAGRMESMSINGVVQAEYTYNARGQQVIRNLTQAGYRIHVIHDKDGNRLAEYQIDNTTGVSTLLQEYIWHDGVPVAVVDGQTDEVFLVRTDHIGRPVFATDMSGVKVWEATYLPFGGVHVSTGANMELRFPGQWFQAESGLHQNWMREYDPTTGRYIQADPLGLVDGASVYSYALQNPGRYVDPRGENSFSTITQPRVPEGPRVGGGGSGSGFGGGGAAIAATIGNILRGARALPQSIAKEGEVCKSCPPCKPYPVGDVGFIGPETHLRGRDAGTAHYHIYEVQQIPSTCKCFWRETTKRITGNHHSLVPMGHNLNGLGRPPAYP